MYHGLPFVPMEIEHIGSGSTNHQGEYTCTQRALKRWANKWFQRLCRTAITNTPATEAKAGKPAACYRDTTTCTRLFGSVQWLWMMPQTTVAIITHQSSNHSSRLCWDVQRYRVLPHLFGQFSYWDIRDHHWFVSTVHHFLITQDQAKCTQTYSRDSRIKNGF